MLSKKEKKGKCPLRNFKECSSDCVLYRTGTRTNDLTNETFHVELCAFNVIADNIEAVHNRTFCLQQEMGETKNVMAFHVLAECGLKSKDEAARVAKRALIPKMNEIAAEEADKEKKLIEK
jgi:hypothetical protein